MTTNLIYGYNIFLGIIFLIFLFVGVWAFIVFLRNFKAQVAAKRKEAEKDSKSPAHDEPKTEAAAKVALVQTGENLDIPGEYRSKIFSWNTDRDEKNGTGSAKYYEVVSERRHRI